MTGSAAGRMSPVHCDRRAQANLVALVGALFALTTAMVIGVALADSALASERRDPGNSHAATAVAADLVSAESPVTNRTNVFDGSAVDDLSAEQLRRRYPVLDGRSVRVSLDDETVVSDGAPAGGSTMRRLVLVERLQRHSFQPRFSGGNRATLPRRTSRVDLRITPPTNVSVSTVRAADRTVLHDPDDGLAGSHTVTVSRRETVTLTFVANGSLSRGDVELTLYPRETTKATLAVTVDD